jgi:multidrug efflux pump subunit AcrB
MTQTNNPEVKGLIPKIVQAFLDSKLSLIVIILGFALGAAAVLVTPREEEPQIVVPMADVYVQAPGASAKEIEKLVATPLEKLLWQIDGVEYVYSISQKNRALVTVRFYVGEDRERSLVKLYNQIRMHKDQVPPLVANWVVKPVEIDDVPIVNLTLYSTTSNDYQLRRIGQEVLSRLTEVKNISRSQIVGGRKREIRVKLDPTRMSGLHVSALEVIKALQGADTSVHAGDFSYANQVIEVSSDSFLHSAQEVKNLVVGVHQGKPVYIQDLAKVVDGPEEPSCYTRIGFSHLYAIEKASTVQSNDFSDEDTTFQKRESFPAVTLALAKKKGTNAVWVARDILEKVDELKATVIPDHVQLEVTRNYGKTAQDKVNSLLSNLFFAVLTVVILLTITLGGREAIIVALAVPISFSLALFVNYLLGYTINRVTLFALILSLGLVVDDPITNVDNIQRHIRKKATDAKKATLYAVQEVLPAVLMSTLAIIVSFSPMFFITGMMGPYMAPMAANVPLTVGFSTVCALTIVPWMSYNLLGKRSDQGQDNTTDLSMKHKGPVWTEALYRKIVTPFMTFKSLRWLLLLVILTGLLISMSLIVFKKVPLKMLPFDNKDEFQLVIDLPEGTPMERTSSIVGDFEQYLRQVPEVTNVVSYVGTSSPMDFNGLVRHYYLRHNENLADIRVNLLDKDQRAMQSHEIVLRLRQDLEKIAIQNHVALKIVEVPPGPPVLSTVVGEIYGQEHNSYPDLMQAAKQLETIMHKEPFVTDIDDTTIFPQKKLSFLLDREKAALHGVSSDQINKTLSLTLSGMKPATVHLPEERSPLMINVLPPTKERIGRANLSQLSVKSQENTMVALGELGEFTWETEEQPIYHKNLQRVVYVTSEMAGRSPAEAILDMQAEVQETDFPLGTRIKWDGEGEWQITLRVFRDLGIAFAAALVGIYILLTVQTSSFVLPFVILLAIPLTLLGIMPGFWLLNLVTNPPIHGYANPVFFTATAMIGMIALGGIVIPNSLVLIEFIHDALDRGERLSEAIIQSGATRLRPIVLTAMTTGLGVWSITLDPVFSGLAWALIFGLLASTVFTLLVVPITYYAMYRKKHGEDTQAR